MQFLALIFCAILGVHGTIIERSTKKRLRFADDEESVATKANENNVVASANDEIDSEARDVYALNPHHLLYELEDMIRRWEYDYQRTMGLQSVIGTSSASDSRVKFETLRSVAAELVAMLRRQSFLPAIIRVTIIDQRHAKTKSAISRLAVKLQKLLVEQASLPKRIQFQYALFVAAKQDYSSHIQEWTQEVESRNTELAGF